MENMQAVINIIEENWEAFKMECNENGTDPEDTLDDLMKLRDAHNLEI